MLSDSCKYVCVIHKLRKLLRRILRMFQMLESVKSVYLHKKCQIKRTIYIINVIIRNIKILLQDLNEPFIHVILNFKLDCLAPLSFLNLSLNLLQEICNLFLINLKISITHNSVWMRCYYMIVKIKLLDILLNNLFKQNNHSLILFR